uniref:Uncharacterized protein n=1 Tax=Romanomermis culicivorax TaxID=13658 RepID=A0A915KWB2_ROMCU
MYSTKYEENGSSIKVVVLGGPSTGKSSLIEQYVHQQFSDQHQVTKACRVYCTTVTVNDSRLYDVEILDTPPVFDFPTDADQEWRSGLTGYGLRKADVYFVVLDVTSPQSYLITQKLVRQVLASSKPESKIFIIANKYDLLENKSFSLCICVYLLSSMLRRKKSTSNNPQLVQINISRIFNNSSSNSPRQQNFLPSPSESVSSPFNRLILNFTDGGLQQQQQRHNRHHSGRDRQCANRKMTTGDQFHRDKKSGKQEQKFNYFFEKMAKKCGKHSQCDSQNEKFTLIFGQQNSIGNSNNTNLHSVMNNLEKNIPLLTCSAKFNWRVTAIFRQAIFSLQDNQDQRCVSASSNSLSNSPMPAMIKGCRRSRSSKACKIQ